jgi:hypothetical protein
MTGEEQMKNRGRKRSGEEEEGRRGGVGEEQKKSI